jgi:hypothetical protein
MQDGVRIGIDENGLGPRLGPLVVTAVVAVTTGDGHVRAESRPKGALRKRLDDSKKLVTYRDNALGEAWARAIAKRMGHGPIGTPAALVRALSLDAAEVLEAPCPREHASQCWSAVDEEFACDPKLLARVERDLAKLEDAGVNVTRAACVVTCARRLNEGVERGLTRFHMDLHAMERLTIGTRPRSDRSRAGCTRWPKKGARAANTRCRASGASRSCATPTRSTSSSAWRRWSASGCATC